MWYKQKFRINNVPVNDLREKWPHRESIMTPKFQCGAIRTKGPDRERLACESTTPRCNLHLEDKPTAGKPACEILATKMNEKTQ